MLKCEKRNTGAGARAVRKLKILTPPEVVVVDEVVETPSQVSTGETIPTSE